MPLRDVFSSDILSSSLLMLHCSTSRFPVEVTDNRIEDPSRHQSYPHKVSTVEAQFTIDSDSHFTSLQLCYSHKSMKMGPRSSLGLISHDSKALFLRRMPCLLVSVARTTDIFSDMHIYQERRILSVRPACRHEAVCSFNCS